MLRIRLASLALAGGLLFTMSGCCSFCEDGKMFPRLFRSNSSTHSGTHSGMEGMPGGCDCHSAHMPQMEGGMVHGPVLTNPGVVGSTVPIPITNIPANQPPQIFKVPQSSPTPYVPTN